MALYILNIFRRCYTDPVCHTDPGDQTVIRGSKTDIKYIKAEKFKLIKNFFPGTKLTNELFIYNSS